VIREGDRLARLSVADALKAPQVLVETTSSLGWPVLGYRSAASKCGERQERAGCDRSGGRSVMNDHFAEVCFCSMTGSRFDHGSKIIKPTLTLSRRDSNEGTIPLLGLRCLLGVDLKRVIHERPAFGAAAPILKISEVR